MAMPKEHIEERTKLLAQLQKLEDLGKEFKVPLSQALAQQSALKSQTNVDQLKRLLASDESKYRDPAKSLLQIWYGLIREVQAVSEQHVAPTNQQLVQAVPASSSEELNKHRLKLEGYAQTTGVTLDQVTFGRENKTITVQKLQSLIDSTGEKERQAAGHLLESWQHLILAKAEEVQRLRGATPKLDTPPMGMKIVENSVSEIAGLQGFEQHVVELHNTWRRNHTDFKQKQKRPLEYDKGLAEHAQGWANQLAQKKVQGHNPNRTVLDLSGVVGENIYRSSWTGATPTQEQLLKTAVDGWALEYKDYDFVSHKSKNNKPVGHFTQVVWDATTKVGCGFIFVEMAQGQKYCAVVCCYHPAGNVVGHHAENI
jgi:uncharacterized protein YkwD